MDEAFETLTLREITDSIHADSNNNNNNNNNHHHHQMSHGSAAATPPPREVSFESTSTRNDRNDGVRLSTSGARRLPRSTILRSSARSTPDLARSAAVRSPSPEESLQESFHSTSWSMAGVAPHTAFEAAAHHPHIPLPDQSSLGYGLVDPTRRSGPLLPPHLSSLDIPTRFGGNAIFDLYSLNYVSEPDVNLLCPVCHDPMTDPVTTPCDHTFCYRCLRRCLTSSPGGSVCPIDREHVVWMQCFSAARLIRTQLNSLLVKCPFSARGCELELRRESVERHAMAECSYRKYVCPGADCNRRIRYKPTDDKCRHVQDNCNYCFAVIEDAEREFHLLSCPSTRTRCLHCWQLVRRDSMEVHESLECGGVEVPCPFADVGCPVRWLRGSLELHLMSCPFHPDTPSGAIIRTQRNLINSYGELGAQLRDIYMRQDQSNARLDEIVAAMAYRAIEGTADPDGDAGRGSGSGSGSNLRRSRITSDVSAGFEEVHQNLTQLEARQSMWTMNQVMPIREEVTELRSNINMLRMHVNWLVARGREESRARAANGNPGPVAAAVAAAAAAPTMRPDNTARIGRLGLPDRRRSTSIEFDIARL